MKETELTRTFQKAAEAFFTRFSDLNPKWITDSKWAHLELEIPPKSDTGFDVNAAIREDEIIVFGAGVDGGSRAAFLSTCRAAEYPIRGYWRGRRNCASALDGLDAHAHDSSRHE